MRPSRPRRRHRPVGPVHPKFGRPAVGDDDNGRPVRPARGPDQEQARRAGRQGCQLVEIGEQLVVTRSDRPAGCLFMSTFTICPTYRRLTYPFIATSTGPPSSTDPTVLSDLAELSDVVSYPGGLCNVLSAAPDAREMARAQRELFRRLAQRHAQEQPDSAGRRRAQGRRGQVRQIFQARAGPGRLSAGQSGGLSENSRSGERLTAP